MLINVGRLCMNTSVFSVCVSSPEIPVQEPKSPLPKPRRGAGPSLCAWEFLSFCGFLRECSTGGAWSVSKPHFLFFREYPTGEGGVERKWQTRAVVSTLLTVDSRIAARHRLVPMRLSDYLDYACDNSDLEPLYLFDASLPAELQE
eukprot:1254270-Amphidinium_carterae.1